MDVAESREEVDWVHGPINCRVVASKPWFFDDQIPTSKFSNVEGKVFEVLINHQLQSVSMCDLFDFRSESIGKY